MNPISNHPEEEPCYFDDATVSMQISNDCQTQTRDWLVSRDRPWSALHEGILETQPQTQADYRPDRPLAQGLLLDYRSTGIQSECETILSDSGYRSYVPPSIEDTSVYGEDSFLHTRDVEQELGSLHLDLQDNTRPIDSSSYNSPKLQGVPTKGIQSSDAGISCEGCGKWLRTKAELNKHDHRHKKPFPCPYVECKRHLNGFASKNDAVRHQMTVHKRHDLGKTYICRHESCAVKDAKTWPRADNFRSHLDRVHNVKKGPDDDLSEYLFRPSHPIAEDLSGVGAYLQDPLRSPGGQDTVADHAIYTDVLDIPISDTSASRLSSSTQASLCNDKLLMPPPPSKKESRRTPPTVLRSSHAIHYQLDEGIATSRRITVTSSGKQAAIVSPKSSQPSASGIRTPDTGYRQPTKHQEMSDIEVESKPSAHEEFSTGYEKFQGALNHETPVASSLSSTSDEPELDMESLRKIPKHILEELLARATENTEHEDTRSTSGSQTHQICPRCHKPFPRQCDLKKHMKRHERPYGCTANGCNKKFGSKNDWKRHENGQHNQTDIWQCDKECAKFSNRREGFESHLRNFHRVMDDGTIQDRLANNRLGSHCSGLFWCGFCRKMIAVNNDAKRVDERFDHIDNHFMGRLEFSKQPIENWHHVEQIPNRLSGKRDASHKRKPTRQPTARPAKQSRIMAG